MKAKDLIAHLQKFPPNMEVMIWEGFNCEYHPKIKVTKRVARRHYMSKKRFAKVGMEKSSIGPWEDRVAYSHGKEFIQKKNIISLCPIGPKKVEGLR